MKKETLITLFACFLSGGMFSLHPEKGLNPENNSIVFTENKGQIADQNYHARPDVLYSGTNGPLAFHIRNNGISYQLSRVDRYKEVEGKFPGESRKLIDQQTLYRIDLNWLNTNASFYKSTDEQVPGYTNYYLQQCPNGALNVPSYKGLWLKNIYTGINLHYYEKNGALKYDYVVSAGADYTNIQFEIKGAEPVLREDGSLELKSPLGTIVEEKPIAFQLGKELNVQWQLKGNVLGFKIDEYDPAQELIIDPVVRVWGSYYGGSGEDEPSSVCSNSGGDVYMAGTTSTGTSSLIATSGGHQNSFGGAAADAFMAKFNSGGFRLWATYYGGSGVEDGNACAIDASGNVYMAGNTTTTASAVMSTAGAHQQVSTGSSAFLVKLNSSGIRLWGTFYGGSGGEKAFSCSTDGSGNIFMSGITYVSTGTAIATAGAHQSVYGGGNGDAYLVKFNGNGVRQWGTYYGGAEDPTSAHCTADNLGNAYLVTSTDGTVSALVSNGAHQTIHGGSYDVLVVKFNSAGARQWATFYGGSNAEYAHVCAADAFGNLYVTGNTTTYTGTAVATPGSHQSVAGGGFFDAYLVKFNSSGVRQWGTYYGGTLSEHVRGCVTDPTGNVYLGGYTSSTNGTAIATSGSHQENNGGGSFDGYLVKFTGNGARLWGSYYGGQGDDKAYGCSLDASGFVYLTGTTATNSGTAMATNSGYQATHGGGTLDGFLVRFKDCDVTNPLITANALVCAGDPLNFSVSVSGTVAVSYSWSGPAAFSSNSQNPAIPNVQSINSGTYTLTVNAGNGCIESTSIAVTVEECTGISELSSNHEPLKVYPNPGNDVFIAELKEASALFIYSEAGQLVFEKELPKGKNKLDLSHLAKGLYFVKSLSNVIKLIKQH